MNCNAVTPGRFSSPVLLKWLSIGIFTVLIFAPLIALLVAAAEYVPTHYSDIAALLIPTERRLLLLLNSLGLSLAVSISGIAIGTLAAIRLWRCESGILSSLRWLVLVLTLVPPYIHALAWSSALQKLNDLLGGLGVSQVYFQGWAAAWWVQLMSSLPLAVGLALVGMKCVEPLFIDAARVIRSDIRSFIRIILPLAAPMLLATAGILFLLNIMDYSVPYLFQLNVYPLEIFAEFSASNEPARAFLYSLPLLIIAVFIVASLQHGLRNVAQSTSWGKPSWLVSPTWPAWFHLLQWFAIAVLFLQVVVPLFSLTALTGTWHSMLTSITSASSEITFTLWVALLAALLSLPLAAGTAIELFRQQRWRWLWWLIVLMPLAVPPPLIGVGLISIWNRPMLLDIYGSAAMPVLAALVRFTSFAVLVLAVQLKYIDRLLIDAAAIIQPKRFRIWSRVWFPMLLPGLLAAAGIVFAMTTGELGATLLVAPPGQATLTMRIYNFLHYGSTSTVAGLCLLMAAIALATGLIAIGALAWWARLSSGKERSA